MYEFNYFQVKDVMTPDPLVIKQNATFEDVEKIFFEHDFNGLPVVENDNKLIGMVTKFDLLKAFTKRMKNPYYEVIKLQDLSRIMVKDPVFFEPGTPLTRVIKKIVETGYKSFPVAKNNQVIGMVSREDIIEAIDQSTGGDLPFRLQSTYMDKMPEYINESGDLNIIIVSHI